MSKDGGGEAGEPVNVLFEAGPVAFLARRALDRVAAAKRFHTAAGQALDAAMEAALDDLPRLWLRVTATEACLAKAVRLGALFLAAAKEAEDSLRGAHTEASLAFYAEMALEREEQKKRGAA